VNEVTQNSTEMNMFLKPYSPARFEPMIFCSVGVDDNHYTTPPRHGKDFIYHFKETLNSDSEIGV
jgi:hypothetical protein